jgi:hypothetical protein
VLHKYRMKLKTISFHLFKIDIFTPFERRFAGLFSPEMNFRFAVLPVVTLMEVVQENPEKAELVENVPDQDENKQ